MNYRNIAYRNGGPKMKCKSYSTKYRIRNSDKLILVIRAYFDSKKRIVKINDTCCDSDGTSIQVKSPTIEIIEARKKKAQADLELEYKAESESLTAEMNKIEEEVSKASEERKAFLNKRLNRLKRIESYKEEVNEAEKTVIDEYYGYMNAFYIRRVKLNIKRGEINNVQQI